MNNELTEQIEQYAQKLKDVSSICASSFFNLNYQQKTIIVTALYVQRNEGHSFFSISEKVI